MNEFRGTKGKWTYIQNTEFPTLHEIWSDSKGIFNHGIYIARTCFAPSSKANALLISKAPELLQFIQEHYRFLNLDDQEKAKQLIKEATEL